MAKATRIEYADPEAPEVTALPNRTLDRLYLPAWSWGDDPAGIVAAKISGEEHDARLDAEDERDRVEHEMLECDLPPAPAPDWGELQDRLEGARTRLR